MVIDRAELLATVVIAAETRRLGQGNRPEPYGQLFFTGGRCCCCLISFITSAGDYKSDVAAAGADAAETSSFPAEDAPMQRRE